MRRMIIFHGTDRSICIVSRILRYFENDIDIERSSVEKYSERSSREISAAVKLDEAAYKQLGIASRSGTGCPG